MRGCDDELARLSPVRSGDRGNRRLASWAATFATKVGDESDAVVVPPTPRFAQIEWARTDPTTRREARGRRCGRSLRDSASMRASTSRGSHFVYLSHDASGDRTERRPAGWVGRYCSNPRACGRTFRRATWREARRPLRQGQILVALRISPYQVAASVLGHASLPGVLLGCDANAWI